MADRESTDSDSPEPAERLEDDLATARPRYEDATWQRFAVPYEYPIAFTRGVFDPDNPLLADLLALREPAWRHRCLAFVDDGIARARPRLAEEIENYFARHADRIELAAPPEPVPGGEPVKRDNTYVEAAYETIQRLSIDPRSYVLAVGGGAVLDTIGFAAATAQRGTRLVRVPTTVSSQSVSGVGVENGVNRRGRKDFLGAFAPPWAVIDDFDFITTLPARERAAGLAGAVRLALTSDRELFDWIEQNVAPLAHFAPAAEEEIIRRTAALHARQTAAASDPSARTATRPADFGLWAAHKLESLTEHRMRHGEALAIGMALDARYSVTVELLEPGEDERIVELLERLGLAAWQPALHRKADDGRLAVLDGLREFQQRFGATPSVPLLAAIGSTVEVDEIDHEHVVAAIEWLRTRAQG